MGECLYNSNVCRLCAENNSSGELLYPTEEVETDLCSLVNRYLPLQVKDDGKLPRTVCPGCNIQLQATVQFFELLVEGQKKLRMLWKEQVDREKKKKEDEEAAPTEIEIQATRIQGEDGNIYMMITVPSDKGELMYTEDNQLALRMEGLEKPRRKRGRPPKPKVDPEEIVQPPPEPPPLPPEPEEAEEEVEEGGRARRRRRKLPFRYRESVAGPEMDRIFREQGVIDPEEDDLMYEEEAEEASSVRSPGPQKEGVKEVIGHMETPEGHDLGQLVVVSKSRGKSGGPVKGTGTRGRKKGSVAVTSACEVCGKTFSSRSKLHMHRLDHKWNFECETCREKFPDKLSLDSHHENLGHEGMMVHEDKEEEAKIQTQGSEEVPSEPQEVEEEEEEEEEEGRVPEGQEGSAEVSTCSECTKSFINKQFLEDHIKAAHQGLRPYACSICEKTYSFSNSLKMHMAATHGMKSEIKEDEPSVSLSSAKAPPGCTCDICGKVLNHPSSVIYHKEAEHNNGRRFVCNKCGKAFKHKQLLQRHQLVHTDERPFVCTTCNASFKTKANLMNHLPTHTGEKKYFCDLCGQQFAHKTSLTLHYRWHTGEKPFQCKVCGKNFSQNGNLMEHMRIHTGEKPFFCNFCGRRFTTSSQFKLHIKRHTGERPWKCEFCGKAFLHKDTWKCHVRRHRGERPYSCEFCQRGFTEQWALKKHLRIHTGEKPYSCETCGKAFSDCSNLTKHKKIHRGSSTQELKEDEGEGVVWQLVQTDGEDDRTQHIIYVTYQGDEEEEEEEGSQVTTETTEEQQQPSQQNNLLQQLSQSNSGLVLGTSEGEEVLLGTLGGGLPMVVPSEAQLQLAETGASSGTLQMASADGGMSMPVTLTMEDGQLVAHIPSGAQFLSSKVEGGNKTENTREEEGEENLQIQLVTEDGRAVQLISTPGEEGGTAFSINFEDSA